MKMRTLCSLIAAALLTLATSAASANAPALLPMQGYLTNGAGAPLNGSYNIRFRLYPTSLGGTPLFEETPSVFVDNGYFTVYLGDTIALPLTLFQNNSTVYVGVRVGNDVEGMPLIELATAPYAAFAQYCATSVHADTATTATSATTASTATTATTATNANYATTAGDAATVGGATAASLRQWGSLTGVPSTFPPNAHTHALADVTGAQARVVGTCPTNSSIRAIDALGAVTCEPDSDTTYTVSTGITLLGNTIGLDQTTVLGWCFDTEGELTAVLDDNYAPLNHTHAANTLTGNFNAITSTGTVTATGFNYAASHNAVLFISAAEFVWDSTYLAGTVDRAGGPYLPQLAFDATTGSYTMISVTAPVHLPEGATMTGFNCFWQDADATADMAMAAYVYENAYNPFTYVYASTPVLNGAGTAPAGNYNSSTRLSFAQNGSPLVVVSNLNSFVHYTMEVRATNLLGTPAATSGLRFYGCNINYTMASPAY